MKKLIAVLVSLCGLLPAMAQNQPLALDNFWLDYSAANFDDTFSLWRLHSSNNLTDTAQLQKAALFINGPLWGYTDPTDATGSIESYNYYFNPIAIDSIFAYSSHQNHSQTTDTIVMQLVNAPNGAPGNTVYWSDTVFTNQSLSTVPDSVVRIALAPAYTTFNGQNVAISIQYFGAATDTFRLLAGARDSSGMYTTLFENSFSLVAPIAFMAPNASILNPIPNRWAAQNWKLGAYITYGNDISISVTEEGVAKVKLYPNPAINIIKVEVPQGVKWVQAELLNSLGQVVFNNTLNNTTTIDVSRYSKGLYYARL